VKSSFVVKGPIKIYKDINLNRVLIEAIKGEKSKFDNNNDYKLLGTIIKEKNKFFYVPSLIELGNDKENVNEVPWLIYNNKTNPEINHSYILKEGDIIKMGNAVFQIKMIQINENEKKDNFNDIESNNNTLLVGSANHSLILNENYEHININTRVLSLKKNASLCSEKNKKPDNEKQVNSEKMTEEKQNINKNKLCRICYQDEDDNLLNPLIRPCKCSGSMKYIHLKCLLHWLKSRTSNNQMPSNSINNENFNAYYINQNTECELCKQLFPDYIIHNNIKYCLIDFDYAQEKKIKENNNYNNEQNYANTNMDNCSGNKNNEAKNEKNFIVLDTVFPLTDTNKYRYIVKFNSNNEMKIGRGLDNQLILNEITVSRNHCLLTLQKNKYGNYEIKMEDESSKFGSLVLIQTDKIEIIKGKPLHLQVSNIYLVFQYKRDRSLLSCCNVDVVDDKNSYETMNYKAVKNKNVVKVLTEINSDDGGDNNEEAARKEKNEKNEKNENKELKINKKKEGDVLSLNNNNILSNKKENENDDNKNNNNNINDNAINKNEVKKDKESVEVEVDNET
jgi:hypothetical protein